jgi:phosphatidylinositol glycan class T
VGYGHQKGGIVTKIYNSDPKTPLNIVYLDVIPWFLRVFLHTLKIVDGTTRNDVTPLKLDFVPGVDRQRPYSIEMVLQVPPKSFLEISIGFEHSLLKWLEYPPGEISLMQSFE